MNPPKTAFLVLVASQLAACEEYYTVEEACDDKVAGASTLLQQDADGMIRINCYRKLTGVAKLFANSQVQEAARNELDYVVKNPSVSPKQLTNDTRYKLWYTQTTGAEGFTGASVSDRLTDPVDGAGYVFLDQQNTAIWEYLFIDWDRDGETTPSGADAVDHLMRDAQFRQAALQPSFVDGAYAEVELSQDWFRDAGWETEYPGIPLPTGGHAYYMLTLFTQPHLERAGNPVLLPKEDQTGVPLYSWSHTPLSADDPTRTQVGYGLTFQVGALDPANFDKVVANQYGAEFEDLSLSGPDGDLDLMEVLPEVLVPTAEDGTAVPDGLFLRDTVAVYPVEFLEPSTTYHVTGIVKDMDHPDGWDLDYQFTTAAEDPGMDAAAHTLPGTTGGTATSRTRGHGKPLRKRVSAP